MLKRNETDVIFWRLFRHCCLFSCWPMPWWDNTGFILLSSERGTFTQLHPIWTAVGQKLCQCDNVSLSQNSKFTVRKLFWGETEPYILRILTTHLHNILTELSVICYYKSFTTAAHFSLMSGFSSIVIQSSSVKFFFCTNHAASEATAYQGPLKQWMY